MKTTKDNIKKFLYGSASMLLVGALFGVMPMSVSAKTPDEPVGKIYTKTIKQEFGRQEVLVGTIDRDTRTTQTLIYVEIEGMPCIVYAPEPKTRGLTCDWSRWKGRSFSEAQKPTPSEIQKVILDYKKTQQKSKSVGVLAQ